MIFDAILIILLYMSLKKAGEKGCTDDLNFAIGFLFSVRLAGAFYGQLSNIVGNFIKNSENLSVYISYAVLLFFLLYLYNAIFGKRIIGFGKKIPKKTGTLLTYIFSIFKIIIIYSIIFSFLNTIPLIQNIKPAFLVKPYSYQLTYGVIGSGSEEILTRIKKNLSELSLGFFEKQKKIHEQGANKTLDAIQQNKELDSFIQEEDKE